MNDEPTQPPAGDARWKDVGRVLRSRREQLGLAQHDLAARGGPSAATVRYAENGQAGPYRMTTILAFERALEWEPGSFMRTLEGGDPKTAKPEAPVNDAVTAALARLEEGLKRLPDQIAAAAGGHTVRIPDDTWVVLTDLANRDNATIADTVVRCIVECDREHQGS